MLQEQTLGILSCNTVINPKEQVNAISLKNERTRVAQIGRGQARHDRCPKPKSLMTEKTKGF